MPTANGQTANRVIEVGSIAVRSALCARCARGAHDLNAIQTPWLLFGDAAKLAQGWPQGQPIAREHSIQQLSHMTYTPGPSARDLYQESLSVTLYRPVSDLILG